jgi:hypothetical protein
MEQDRSSIDDCPQESADDRPGRFDSSSDLRAVVNSEYSTMIVLFVEKYDTTVTERSAIITAPKEKR